ncbi:VacB/RNase II family 3'-5' exoribonuclease [Aestuariicella hydrocarbonica]|uniref:exoribonuclease II n=1 Tax=Pseudomaricurvus hydrocarbonicus TaxID=1470433 RepID=A0A9E5MMV0_9GAMM|nr:VacB/RNase II family 3'-5' exoribonuclease [Aestuariicella hydrocarbonica]NHO67130.1 VacB/RNase II family 3'-5' exoribonuclease [Aestuariicella hydrocarbonica]
MLDLNALNQLNQLKQTIRSDKNLFQGTVRGSQGRFGFVVLEDGREAFLAPDEMARVLPGDRVEVSVTEKAENPESNKVDAELDKLISSTTKTLVGQYVVRGKGHFVSVDMPQLNRWVFIPPKARGKAQEGDFLVCRLVRHPFEDGKGQAKVTDILGKPGDVGIEHAFISQKHNLPTQWRKEEQTQVDAISSLALTELPDYDARTKLQDSLFVTIDSESTKDMDDALSIETTDSGWLLKVAIADPTASIAPNSALDKTAMQRANTAYLPGRAITMLPETLSNHTYSLVPGEDRPALLCQMQINHSGEIEQADFEFSIIRSAHKLSYDNVAALLEQEQQEAVPTDCHDLLKTLLACSQALNNYRRDNMLLMEERDDFDLVLNEKMHIADIRRQSHNLAQQIVQEAMLATNRSAGDLFARHNLNTGSHSGIFSSHKGFRAERLESIKKVVAEDFPDLAELDLETLDGYRQLIHSLHGNPEAASQLAAFRLMLQAGVLTTDASPHLGLAMEHYATVTSPIRRYNDFFNHRAIRAILEQKSLQGPSVEALAEMQKSIGTTRSASRDLEQWLICLFMEQQQGKTLDAKVFRVTSQGITVKLDEWGVNGFVKLNPKAFKFDPDRMSLCGEEQSFLLDQPLQVQVSRVDLDKKRINFNLV